MNHWRLGVVSFLNAKPLIQGLDRDPSINLVFDVPSRLAAMLDSGAVDCALVPVIDLGKPGRHWQIISDACIGCDGETFTVRVFSRGPAKNVRRIHVDGDSHTSVALARVIWREQFGCDVQILPFPDRDSTDDCEAVLLIGDKVVNHGLIGFDIETDLGSAWKTLTGLPFVFAVWAMPQTSCRKLASRNYEHALVAQKANTADLAAKLSRARDLGVQSADLIAADFGPGMGWPVALARRYLTARLKFKMTPREHQAIHKFMDLAKQSDLVPADMQLAFA